MRAWVVPEKPETVNIVIPVHLLMVRLSFVVC